MILVCDKCIIMMLTTDFVRFFLRNKKKTTKSVAKYMLSVWFTINKYIYVLVKVIKAIKSKTMIDTKWMI